MDTGSTLSLMSDKFALNLLSRKIATKLEFDSDTISLKAAGGAGLEVTGKLITPLRMSKTTISVKF